MKALISILSLVASICAFASEAPRQSQAIQMDCMAKKGTEFGSGKWVIKVDLARGKRSASVTTRLNDGGGEQGADVESVKTESKGQTPIFAFDDALNVRTVILDGGTGDDLEYKILLTFNTFTMTGSRNSGEGKTYIPAQATVIVLDGQYQNAVIGPMNCRATLL